MAEEEIKLKVGELTGREDFGRGTVRLDTNTMKKIGVKEGDIVEIEGKIKTGAVPIRSYPADVGLNIIRMDGLVRKNCDASIGEFVKIRKANVKEAKKVTLAPAQKGYMINIHPNLLKQNLIMRPMNKGDIIITNPVFKSRRNNEDIFSQLLKEAGFDINVNFGEEVFFPMGSEIRFVVVKTIPEGVTQITSETEVELLPEAVEVGAARMPEVTYEDIGGLGEIVPKIREMIELPLRRPEVFERLGIEAPKGVLLHGSPGTGKTLIAKAVANEAGANFISVAGPEFMSKFYGESLPYDEKILIKDNGIIKLEKIGKIVENPKENIEVACFDENHKSNFMKIKRFIKHKMQGKLLEVRTKSGRSIKVTDYHSLFTLTENGLESVETKRLVLGKSFIATPKLVLKNPSPLEEIDLIEILKENDYNLRVRPFEVWKVVEKAIEKLGWEDSAKILGIKSKYLYDVKNKNIGIRVSNFMNLLGKAGVSLTKEDKKNITINAKRSRLPAVMKVDNSLAMLFGLWLAEGSYSKDEVRVSLNSKEAPLFIAIISKCFDKLCIYRKNENSVDVIICNAVLGRMMQALGFKSGARNKIASWILFNLSPERIAIVLKAYVSGDGALNTKTYCPQVELTTYSKELANDISYLLLYFGIVGKIYAEKEGRYRICFSDMENLRKFLTIGFFDESKNTIIRNYLEGTKQISRRDRIPLEALSKLGIHLDVAYKNLKAIGKNALLKTELDLPNAIKSVLNGDLYLDEVAEIKELNESPEYVYDIEVEPTQNFIGGFGGVFAHNSEENLRRIFDEAEKNAPSIIFIDEIDAIAPKREQTVGEVERRVVSTLLTQMDGLKSRGRVIVIAATNIPNALDPALRRTGRFDREIEIPIPDKKGRKEIFQIHTRRMPLEKDVDLDKLAEITYGYVGADITGVAKEAGMHALRRVIPEISSLKEDESIPKEVLEKLKVTKEDFDYALRMVPPSAMREVLVEIPKVKWEDVGGLEDVKESLKEAVEWPLKNPECFKRIGVKPPKGILLYGPPGVGKTYIVKALANETGVNLVAVKGPEILTMWVGESERKLRDLFRRAKQVAPSIILFDEIDALAPRRGIEMGTRVTEQVVSQLLTELSGIEEMEGVVVIATTNRPDIIDPALLRPGRFDRLIYVPAPDEKTRLEIFKVHTREMPLKGVSLDKLAKETEGYSGADIEALCREAAMFALREDMKAKEITMKNFEKALKKIKPSITEDITAKYQKAVEDLKKTKMEDTRYIG
jgi:SpoVK/Ycf46/Vps4 family AAA+-type ATPase/intein/homing endonuclease